MLSASCFCSPPPSARDIAVVAELVHLATLLHDDVLDESRERRGRLASRCIWGNAVSVLAGDLLLTHALERTEAAAPHSVLVDLFATLRRLVDGEVVQLRGRKQLDPREEVYFHIVRHKTAALFEWAARSGAVCAGAAPEAANALAEFGSRIGLAFQLVDDVLDYTGDPSATGKALFGDLQEGKLTLPLIRAVSSGAVSISDVEAVRGGDPSHAARIADAVRSSGVCDGVRAVALEQTARALASLEPVPRSAARDMLGAIARELAVRGA
jgi:octaprenyl-diphosphate synthase